MDRSYLEDKKFDKTNFAEEPLIQGDYEACQFISCDFTAIDLSNFHFIDCSFQGCNLSMVNIAGTAFRDISFDLCKLVGLHFENADPFSFSVSFKSCSLNLSSFYKLKLKNMKFEHSNLQETDFTLADLTNASFIECDLLNAKFENTILEKADFRSAYNYSIDPTQNKIKKAKFSVPGIIGLLDRFDIIIS
ncbi:MAG: pentapeptide repeat-containing protein [Chitinophagaceae bacterium]|nr:pentapeptide repeat-containing protein [Chitinophagaceae bacterium]